MSVVPSIYLLVHGEIVRAARLQAEAGAPCTHAFAPGSPQALSHEHAYLARKIDIETLELV